MLLSTTGSIGYYPGMQTSNYDFRLKHFGINQGHSAMKVGTDAIALGSWVASLGLKAQKILDVGAGTGILSLMMAQTYPEALVEAIEVDNGACIDAQYNFEASPWHSRLRLHKEDFLRYTPGETLYDLVISNPPFFSSDGIKATGFSRELARNESKQGLGVESLIIKSKELVKPQGTLCLILPYEREEELRRYAAENMMLIKHLCIFSGKESLPTRLMVALQAYSADIGYQICHKQAIVQRVDNGEYSTQYKTLTQHFLLHED